MQRVSRCPLILQYKVYTRKAGDEDLSMGCGRGFYEAGAISTYNYVRI
jgi:hypothetical protein